MSKRIVSTMLFSGLTAITSLSIAADRTNQGNPERSFTWDFNIPSRTQAEVRAELEEFRHHPVTADGWYLVGGEKGYALIPHKYEFHNGKFMHSDNFDYSTGGARRMLTAQETFLAGHEDYKPE